MYNICKYKVYDNNIKMGYERNYIVFYILYKVV